ncbi:MULTISPECIES: dTDP-4-dehydrorhamnose 3,5-epimerase family protein [unclassified Pseudonocardia]|uniref:dTDP-4-dehydrorhamnose 3,5-epimerase family protein n=1 Tax=unclassified Pseudonocardia TaxID=2619320 RepID=UPI0006CB55D4|nr:MULTISPECIES: dTDP-4-dehydrorhamnose 3,5-epimerase [unclassified Pseudonocardia]ALE82582.1 dTDP-4-dehydrorhamnose 3,5-epimerase [Pseudonocardia sp. HH130629-09]ANY10597.1 dTDP-4-dehydrorhamnose 3,5-epimerase [Pseudonocardia sp. HH130630-07]
MEITETAVPGAFRITPTQIPDRRGLFYEAWRISDVEAALGRPFRVAQTNFSVSHRNTLRGIHGTTLPPGQAKLVTCVRGAALDVVVDLRVGSPTFGAVDTTLQEAGSGVGVYLGDGLGHAFLALTDDTCMNYLCDTEYVPGTMIDIQALDPDLAIPWNLTEDPIRSDKDAAAPTLSEAVELGLLTAYREPAGT